MDEPRSQITIERESPTRFRLFSSHFFDFLLFALLGVLLSFAFTPLLRMSPLAVESSAKRDEILLSSHLYQKEGEVLSNIAEITDKLSIPMNDKSSKIDEALTYFFNDFVKGEDHYGKIKATAKSKDGQNMFKDGIRSLANADYDVEYLSFYKDVAINKAPGYLSTNNGYNEARRNLIIVQTSAIVVALTVSYLFFYVAFPLVFHKGKQTIGMKLNHMYLLNVKGISPTWGRYLLFAFVRYLLMFLLAVPLLLVPYFVSITLIAVREERQSLVEFIFGLYEVHGKQDEIFESQDELLRKTSTR